MNIMVLESDISQQEQISKMLDGYCKNISYETSVVTAINNLGLKKIDFALVDADYQKKFGDWKDLTDFLKSINISYSIFSSNGKVGNKNGQKIVSIHDLPNVVYLEKVIH